MPTLEEILRRAMAEETRELHAAPDLARRVMRSGRGGNAGRAGRAGRGALAAAVAVVAAVVPVQLFLTRGPAPAPVAGELSTVATGQAGGSRVFNERVLGHVKVVYLSPRLHWTHWWEDRAEEYTTTWNYDGDENGAYCVQILIREGRAAGEFDERLRDYRDRSTGEEVTIGDRTAYLVTQWVGGDEGPSTPSLLLDMGGTRRAEVMFSPSYAEDLGGPEAVERELRRIGEGLTSMDQPAPPDGTVASAEPAPSAGPVTPDDSPDGSAPPSPAG
ncbi:hypothetical protein [Streptosporangium sandarakinum]|uniref:Uncharacterized protein n=1 Tax=Streptosporangium sandarakinum TaxID=1260955 RepID=A0A852UMX4_9ACTN|nr:hypothetical protein [Streptosporangium sandarakinum]NYF38687.1 hypothetical protein [Streptosporangium sandarakinum]